MGAVARAWRAHRDPVLLGVAAIVVSVLAQRWMFPSFSWNRDEPVYLWQVDALRAGHFTPPDGGFPDAFHPWLSGAKDGVLFSQYTLGWPVVLLIAQVALGTAAAGVVLGVVLVVLGTYYLARELFGDRVVATTAGAAMLASPILAIQGGVYLGYLFTLGLGLFFLLALLVGFRAQRSGLLLLAGILVGWIFLARPFDAILWSAAGAVYLVASYRREWRVAARRILVVGVGALPFVVFALLYNRAVTGSATQFPITAADPLDSFGLGERRIMPGFPKANYTLREAVKSTGKNALVVPLFMVGSYLGLIPAAMALWKRRRETAVLLLVAIGLVFPAGYFWFWGMDVSGTTAPLSGPIYFVPAYAALAILVALGLVHLLRSRRNRGLILVAVLAVVTVPVAANRFEVNRRLSTAQTPWRTSVAGIEEPSLVFVADTQRYLLYLNPYSSNGPELGPDYDDEILYAVDDGPSAIPLIEAYPDRTPLLQRASLTAGEMLPKQRPRTPKIALIPLSVLRTGRVGVSLRLTEPIRARALLGCVQGTRDDGCRRLERGEGEVTTWTFAPVGSDERGADDIPLAHGLGSLTISFGSGRSADVARSEFAARVKVPFRARPDGLAVLLPARYEVRGELENGDPYWRPVDTFETVAGGLDVTVASIPG